MKNKLNFDEIEDREERYYAMEEFSNKKRKTIGILKKVSNIFFVPNLITIGLQLFHYMPKNIDNTLDYKINYATMLATFGVYFTLDIIRHFKKKSLQKVDYEMIKIELEDVMKKKVMSGELTEEEAKEIIQSYENKFDPELKLDPEEVSYEVK